MKYLPFYQNCIGCSNKEQVFQYLTTNFVESIKYWNYLVSWNKVFGNVKSLEIDLNTLNYLVGKPDVETEFRMLLTQQPSIARTIPILLAARDKDFTILTDYKGGSFQYERFSFSASQQLTPTEIDKAVLFAKNTGLLALFETRSIKSVPDYVIGVEVGLDTNGRKNRSGTSMETIVGKLLAEIAQKNNFQLIVQATAKKIQQDWGVNLQVDKSSRTFDFAVGWAGKLYLIETNYYGGGGSKLKATAGEYKFLHDFLVAQGHQFIWITDGFGWKTTTRSLEEAFNHLDYILNLKMVTSGILQEILEGKEES